MSLRFYFALLAVFVGMFGSNVHSSSDGGLGFQSLFNNANPRLFLSALGASTTCPYSVSISCAGKTTHRTIDGSCNNDKAGYVGKSDTPYIRVLPTSYIGGKTPRTKTFFGRPLATPRELTLKFFANYNGANIADDPASTTLTNVVSVFARFIEQDLYDTKLAEATTCCPTPATPNPLCSSIILKADDPYFGQYRKTCLPKPNGVSSPDLGCKDAVSQQVNKNTHYLDLSNVYGSTDTKSSELREKKDGLLKVTVEGSKKPLPLKTTSFTKCGGTTKACFVTGDERANIDPLQMTMYTIWVRLHNEVAKLYKGINSALTDDQLFQEARKIVIAIYQNIVYNEFLPILHSVTSLKTTSETTWVEAVKPQVENRFSIAFTALADTLTPGKFTVGTTEHELKSSWYNPDLLWTGDDGVKPIVEGMLKDKSAKVDRFYTQALFNQYLETVPGNGMDKSAWNVQQARDNGMVGYFVMSAIQKKNYAATYDPLATNFVDDIKTKLTELFHNKYDVDFLPGLLGEKYDAPAETGPLMADILEQQFKRLRDGDKFFFHHKDVFKTEQLTALKELTLSKVLCKTVGLTEVMKNPFNVLDTTNNNNEQCNTLLAKGILDICKWAGEGWSTPVTTPCVGGFQFKTKECQFAPDSPCSCSGSPIEIIPCPGGIQQMVTKEMKDEVEKEYAKYFDSQGHRKPGVSKSQEQVAEEILKRVVAHRKQ